MAPIDTEQFYRTFTNHLIDRYPSVRGHLAPQSLKNLISPFCIPLKRQVLEKIRDAIEVIFSTSRKPEYQNLIHCSDREILNHKTPHSSVLMAYDFHIDNTGENAKLIEINTNGSGFLFAQMLYEMPQDKPLPLAQNCIEKLRLSFAQDLFSFTGTTLGHAAIIDENTTSQKMFSEFLMYKDLMSSWGWTSSIEEFTSLLFNDSNQLVVPSGQPINFIYNRLTDFTLQNPLSATLRKAFLNDAACFSPNPREYILLADKERLVELGRPEFLRQLNLSSVERQVLQEILLPTWLLREYGTADIAWRDRKKLFFKPVRSFGSKSTYKGESLTHKVFERLFREETLVQQYFPAAKIHIPEQDKPWKFDLRVFVYRDQIQLIIARIYQGQVTNFRQELGGFCRVELV